VEICHTLFKTSCYVLGRTDRQAHEQTEQKHYKAGRTHKNTDLLADVAAVKQ